MPRRGEKRSTMTSNERSPCGILIEILWIFTQSLVFNTTLLLGSIVFTAVSLLVTAFWGIVCIITQLFWTLCGSEEFLDIPPRLSSELCDSLELKVIAEFVSHSEDVKSDWVLIEVEMKPGRIGAFQVHSLIISSSTSGSSPTNSSRNDRGEDDDTSSPYLNKDRRGYDEEAAAGGGRKQKPVLLWVHGIGSSAALSFGVTGVIDRLLETYDIYALDLPGFGRSTAPPELKQMTAEEVEHTFIRVIKQYLDLKGIGSVYLVAHSFGSFIALNFTHRHPEMVERLLLVDPGGLFPCQGKDGAFLAILFKWGVPMWHLRTLGRFGVWLFYASYSMVSAPVLRFYWYQVQAAQDGFSDHIVSKFIHLGFSTAYWKRPTFTKFLQLRVPVALAYGETDNIMPAYQGIFLSGLSGGNIPVFIISDAWHMPMAIRRGLDFATVVEKAAEIAAEIDPFSRECFCPPTHIPAAAAASGSCSNSHSLRANKAVLTAAAATASAGIMSYQPPHYGSTITPSATKATLSSSSPSPPPPLLPSLHTHSKKRIEDESSSGGNSQRQHTTMKPNTANSSSSSSKHYHYSSNSNSISCTAATDAPGKESDAELDDDIDLELGTCSVDSTKDLLAAEGDDDHLSTSSKNRPSSSLSLSGHNSSRGATASSSSNRSRIQLRQPLTNTAFTTATADRTAAVEEEEVGDEEVNNANDDDDDDDDDDIVGVDMMMGLSPPQSSSVSDDGVGLADRYQSYYGFQPSLKSAHAMYQYLMRRRRAWGSCPQPSLPVVQQHHNNTQHSDRYHDHNRGSFGHNNSNQDDRSPTAAPALQGEGGGPVDLLVPADVKAVCLVTGKLTVPPVIMVKGDTICDISPDMMDRLMADVTDIFRQHFEPYIVPT